MSKKIFSATDWENVPSNLIAPTIVEPMTYYNSPTSDIQEDIEAVVAEVESCAIDIAPSYGEWVNLGFALVDGLGEMGRAYYHRLSRFHPTYNHATTDKQYTSCLGGKGSGVKVGTLFHYASRLGISHSHIQNTILPDIQNGKTGKWIKEEGVLPSIPESVFANLPPFLAEIVSNSISIDDRDTILLGSIVCLSACFHNICGVYDERIIYPNLYLFVVAEPGMGKGALSLCHELVEPINQQLHNLTKSLEQEYQAATSLYRKNKNGDATIPPEPPMKVLVIPGNSSSSSMMKILGDNDGIGLMIETEGDTLSTTLNSDYGNYSDVLRKAFHHELVSLSRRKDREFCELNNPRLSVALAGTPEQVRKLIPNAENGLMSRFMFYLIPFKRGIRNVFATNDISKSKNAIFRNLGETFLHHREEFLRQGNYSFTLPTHLQELFVEQLMQINNECCDEVDNRMQGVIRRMGLISFRIMMVFTAIRQLNSPLPPNRASNGDILLICHEEDYHSAMTICQTLIMHSIYFYRKLSSSTINKVSSDRESKVRSERFFSLLPDTFTKKIFDATVVEHGEIPSTANKWINKYIAEGKISRTAQGEYKKAEPTPNETIQ